MMLVLLLLALASPWVTALDNGLARTPQVRPAAAAPPPPPPPPFALEFLWERPREVRSRGSVVCARQMTAGRASATAKGS
eukprot:COSAG01_NODE_7838_length_3031_cov_28.054552_1_plen_80_part_00